MEEEEEEEQQQQQNLPPTAKVGAKKQKKLEEKQAKKAQREVRGPFCALNTVDFVDGHYSFTMQCTGKHGAAAHICKLYWKRKNVNLKYL